MAKQPNNKVSMRDVAEAAGVSVGSVSRILAGDSERFADATVVRVRETAKRLNYRPNAIARSLLSGHTNMAGVMVPGDGFYSDIVSGINSTLLVHGHIMLHAWNPHIVSTPDDPTEAGIVHQMIERAVDGIILRPSSEEFERSYFEEIWQRGIPLIAIDREWSFFKTDFVGSDDYAIGQMAARHLIELGHHRVLFLGSPGCSTSRLREQGFRDVVSETPDVACKSRVLNSPPQGQESFIDLMRSTERPTGIFCYADSLVTALRATLRHLDLRVPQDVSIVGCGNLASHQDLTSFDQQPEEIGRQAAQLYLDRIKTDEQLTAPETIRLPAQLVKRGSTARR